MSQKPQKIHSVFNIVVSLLHYISLRLQQFDVGALFCQQELQSQIDALDADLVNIIMNLDILEGELSDKQTELDNVTAQLAQAQEDEQNQYDAMKKRIV